MKGNNYLGVPILAGVFRNSPRGRFLTPTDNGDVTIRGGITNNTPIRDLVSETGEPTCRNRDIINGFLGVDLTLEEYRKQERVITSIIKQYHKQGEETRALTAFMCGGIRRGSKKWRIIIEDRRSRIPNDGIIKKLATRLAVNNGTLGLKTLIPYWYHNRFSTALSEFIFKFTNGKLRTNSMLSHYTETHQFCTFCSLDYWTRR